MLTISSIDTAKLFNKRHDNVIRAIKELNISYTFRGINYKYTHEVNRNALGGPVNCAYYTMSIDGFLFLISGFTGWRAAKKKEHLLNVYTGKIVIQDKFLLSIIAKLTAAKVSEKDLVN
jgi:Rha family phage regulatory protein